jgi:hypothetical protein
LRAQRARARSESVVNRTPVGDTEREQIRALHARGESLSAIAKNLGRSKSTIAHHCKLLHLSFDRSATKEATEAKVADTKAKRAATSQRFLDKANEFMDKMEGSFLVFNFGGKENSYNEHLLDGPPTGDLRNLMESSAKAFGQHLAQERHDSDDSSGLSAVDEWLRGMLGG